MQFWNVNSTPFIDRKYKKKNIYLLNEILNLIQAFIKHNAGPSYTFCVINLMIILFLLLVS